MPNNIPYNLQASTTHVVTYWHIPNGSDYAHADARLIECDSEEEANFYVQSKGENPPALASSMTREQYETICSKLKG